MSILRDIFRRKTRSILTISGVAIGAFSLVVLGAFAENDNVYVEQLTGYYDNVVIVIEKDDANFVGMASGNRPLSMEKVEELRAYPGVREVSPMVAVLLDDGVASMIPRMAMGTEPGSDDRSGWRLSEGRDIEEGESHVTILGYDLAKQEGAKVGDMYQIRGEEFEVIGLLDRTYVNLSDSAAYTTLADAQQLYYDSLPKAFQASVRPEELVQQMSVYPQAGVDGRELALELNRDIAGIKATSSDEMLKTVNSLVGLANMIVISIATLALLIGGLSIVNTMTMSVSERTREIGVRRALGASRRRIAREVLAESAVMGGIGGALGVAAGAVIAVGLNYTMVAATGTSAFLVTGRLAFGALLFAIVVGTIGGLYPARYASRLNPAAALAHD